MKSKDSLYRLAQYLILWITGGFVYVLIELAYRGRSHWSMAVVGGLCFILIGAINEKEHTIPGILHFESQAVCGAFVTTLVELFSGIIINMILHWNVWDYSDVPFNILGQICLPFTIIWVFIAAAAIILDDFLRHILFMEPFPTYYSIIMKKNVNVFELWERYVCKDRHHKEM
ncbi:MAG: putative ABC transporter permease [Lachnospiraceae bacterium]|nr:putative ABC transporter permease [Lachnospiraceae bacterium]